MNKPVIFLDFDGVKFDTLMAHVVYINDKYRINSKPIDYINNPYLHEVINKYLIIDGRTMVNEYDVYEDLGKDFISSLRWNENVPRIKGMDETIPRLAKKYTLWTVTARQVSSIDTILRLLEKHVPGCISGVHCVWRHLGNGNFSSISKRDFIQSFEGDKIAFIDDSAKEIERTQDIIPAYMFDQYGFNDNRHDIKLRVRSWKEIEELFL